MWTIPLTRLIGLGALWLALDDAPERRQQRLIVEENKSFSASEITIQRSDTVFFENNDTVVHNVFSSSQGNKFNLKPQKPGTTAAVVFSASGTALVRCAFHPTMNLVVIVE